MTSKVKLLRPLGEGGMGSVWVAEHLTLDTEVAVKFISTKRSIDDPAVRSRFEREARAAAKIRSDHVIRTFDHGVSDDGDPYIVMELLEGETLRQRLNDRRRLPLGQVVPIAEQVARGLDAAHAQGIVHRDIKPGNVFLAERDDELRVKILDFGIAKQQTPGVEGSVTQTGALIGSPQYMSPEQLLHAKGADHRTDLWSLAVVIYEMVAGRPPFSGETLTALSMAICNGTMQPISERVDGLPAALDGWFDTALATEPEERFQDGRSMIDALCEAIGEAADDGVELAEVRPDGTIPELASTVTQAPDVEGQGRGATFDGAATSATSSPNNPSRWLAGGLALLALGAGAMRWKGARLLWEEDAETITHVTATDVAARAQRAVAEARVAPTARAESGPAVPAGMVAIPSGDYRIGCSGDGCYGDDQPVHDVRLQSYALGLREVTVADYRRCLRDGACSEPKSAPGCHHEPERAQNCVDWPQAQTYCAHVGMRLPTEAEWEVAARGEDGRAFPWGDEPPRCERVAMAGCDDPPEGDRSPFGVADMGGNLREWTASDYLPYPGGRLHGSETGKVNRGGSRLMPPERLSRAHTRHVDAPSEQRPDLGFRCAISL